MLHSGQAGRSDANTLATSCPMIWVRVLWPDMLTTTR
jgi:hypothetical protein